MLEKLEALINGGEKLTWEDVVAAIADYLKELFAFVYEKMGLKIEE